VTEEWRKLHNEELRDLFSSPSIIRMVNEMGRKFIYVIGGKARRKKTSRKANM
jgi:hypothetical protein